MSQRTPTLENVFRTAFDVLKQEIHTALPGRVESYDAATQKADIKPLVKRCFRTGDDRTIVEELPVLTDVPIVFPRGGGFFVSLPVTAGDHVLLIFNESSIDIFQTGAGGDTDPQDIRRHNLSDAVALPGFYPFSKSLADADADNLVIGEDGGVQVHVSDSKIELGEKSSADKASLDSKVQTELTRISTELTTLKTIFDAHIHVTTATVGATTTPGVISPTATPWVPAPATPSPTNSTLVTIKE